MLSAGHFNAGDEMFLAVVVVITGVVDGQGAHVEVSGVTGSVEEIFVVDVVVVVVCGGRETKSNS